MGADKQTFNNCKPVENYGIIYPQTPINESIAEIIMINLGSDTLGETCCN